MNRYGFVMDSDYTCDNNGDNHRIKRSTINMLGIGTIGFLFSTIALGTLFVLAMTTTVFQQPLTCGPATTPTTTTTTTTASTGPPGTYITDLYIITGSGTTCPSGYTQVSQTIGTSSNMPYYLCWSRTAPYAPVTGLSVWADLVATPTSPYANSPWLPLNNTPAAAYPGFNLNTAAPFAAYGFPNYYVYIYLSRSTTQGYPITNVDVLGGGWVTAAPAGWEICYQDLNHGPFGIYLFLIWN